MVRAPPVRPHLCPPLGPPLHPRLLPLLPRSGLLDQARERVRIWRPAVAVLQGRSGVQQWAMLGY